MSLPKLEDLISPGTWNRSYRDMQALLHQSHEARKLIVIALLIIQLNRDLSFGERKMLDQAQNYDKYKAEQDKKVALLSEYRK